MNATPELATRQMKDGSIVAPSPTERLLAEWKLLIDECNRALGGSDSSSDAHLGLCGDLGGR